jgi:hypothetical protein
VGTFFEVYHSKVFEAVGGRWKLATCLFAVKLAAQLQKAVSQLGLCPDGYDHQDHPLNSDSQPCVWNKAFQWHLAKIQWQNSLAREKQLGACSRKRH